MTAVRPRRTRLVNTRLGNERPSHVVDADQGRVDVNLLEGVVHRTLPFPVERPQGKQKEQNTKYMVLSAGQETICREENIFADAGGVVHKNEASTCRRE